MSKRKSVLVPAQRPFSYMLGIEAALVLGIIAFLVRILPRDYRVLTLLISSLAIVLASLAAQALAGQDIRKAALGYGARRWLITFVSVIGLAALIFGSYRFVGLLYSPVVVKVNFGAPFSEPVVIAATRIEAATPEEECPCGTQEGEEGYLPDKQCIEEVVTFNPNNIEKCWDGEERSETLLGLSIYYVVTSSGFGVLVGVLFSAFPRRRLDPDGPSVELKVFISYRRADYRQTAERIYDRFVGRYGEDHVFKDVDNILIGTNFQEEIFKFLQSCDFVLAIIGPRWLDAEDEKGNRRLDQEGDYVRIEIEKAIESQDVEVIPVLVGGAEMPEREKLPESLQRLSGINASEIRDDPDFNRDMERLVRDLEEVKRVSSRKGLWSILRFGSVKQRETHRG